MEKKILVIEDMEKFKKVLKIKGNEVAVEDMMLFCIIAFCENAAQLGCPRTKDVDMWIRELPVKKAKKVMSKLLDIIDEQYK